VQRAQALILDHLSRLLEGETRPLDFAKSERIYVNEITVPAADVSALDINPTQSRPKRKPKTGLVLIRAACAQPEQRAAFRAAIESGWTEVELTEYARLFYFRNGKDTATPPSYRKAIDQIALEEGGPRDERFALEWRASFRKAGSQLRPPRPLHYLKRHQSPDPLPIDHPLHPDHTAALVDLVESRAREYFRIPTSENLHPNCWAASFRAYLREQVALAKSQTT
jgi:hypothetical protein